MLRLTSVSAYYGQIQALRGVSIHVAPGEVVAIIGANGAGKSTLLRAVCGLVPRRRGEIQFDGHDISAASCQAVVRLGLVQVPEGRQVFPTLSVRDNLLLGAYHRLSRERRRAISTDEVYELFPVLAERSRQLAGTLSGGEQQMLAIGRALMARPKMLLLDEPSLGLAPVVAQRIFHTVDELHRRGTTMLLVEQNAVMALRLADRAYVIETGQVVMAGPAKDLLANQEVKRAYLGRGYHEVWE
jgi:branched-chain amino acid transport system ATP-binding protein